MKILQIIPHYVPAFRFGGPLNVAHSLGKALLAQGHDVHVVTTNAKDETNNLGVPVDQPCSVDGITVFYQDVNFFRKWGGSTTLVTRLRGEIQWADQVLVHSHFQFSNWIGARMCRRMRKPYVVFPHCSLRKISLMGSNFIAKLIYLYCLEYLNFKNARFVAFNAEEEMEDSLFAEKGKIVPNGIDPILFNGSDSLKGKFRAQNPQFIGKVIFLFLGRIDKKQKAVDKIVNAFNIVSQRNPAAVLILAGPSEGNDAKEIAKQIVTLGLADKVFMLGLVTGNLKLSLLKDADIFLLTSNYEGLSVALLEAMYSGLPVVVSNRVGLHKKIDRYQCGIVVDPKVESIAEGMQSMLLQLHRSQMNANAHALVSREHIWEAISQDLINQLS